MRKKPKVEVKSASSWCKRWKKTKRWKKRKQENRWIIEIIMMNWTIKRFTVFLFFLLVFFFLVIFVIKNDYLFCHPKNISIEHHAFFFFGWKKQLITPSIWVIFRGLPMSLFMRDGAFTKLGISPIFRISWNTFFLEEPEVEQRRLQITCHFPFVIQERVFWLFIFGINKAQLPPSEPTIGLFFLLFLANIESNCFKWAPWKHSTAVPKLTN